MNYLGIASTIEDCIPYQTLRADPAFRTLTGQLQKLYYRPEQKIRELGDVASSALLVQAVSRSVLDLTFTFNLGALQEFIGTQYRDKATRLGSVITLNGSALHCQATTCRDYLQKT